MALLVLLQLARLLSTYCSFRVSCHSSSWNKEVLSRINRSRLVVAQSSNDLTSEREWNCVLSVLVSMAAVRDLIAIWSSLVVMTCKTQTRWNSRYLERTGDTKQPFVPAFKSSRNERNSFAFPLHTNAFNVHSDVVKIAGWEDALMLTKLNRFIFRTH